MLKQIRDHLQLDRALATVLATRLWQAVSGPITIILLIRSLSLAEQGVYYAIIGIVGIQAYFELGLLNVLVSQAGHLWAAIAGRHTASPDSTAEESRIKAAARLRDLIQAALRWFAAASLLYALCAWAFGSYSLRESDVSWQEPLWVIVPLAAVSVFLAPAMSILEGAGQRDLVYRFRLIQMVAGSLVVWTALVFGWKLWALVASTFVQATMALIVIFGVKGSFFRHYRNLEAPKSDFDWMHQVVPIQWRLALISATFHFATQFFVVIVVMFHSDEQAGPLGMTLSVTGALQMLALAWVQTKYPVISAHHGAGQREVAGTIWRRTALISTSLLILGFITLAALIASLPLIDSRAEQRFVSPVQILVLSIGCIANHIAAVQGFYVLARRARPLLAASLAGSLSTAAAVWIGGYLYAVQGVIVGYSAAMALVLVPAHSWAYYRFRQRTDPAIE